MNIARQKDYFSFLGLPRKLNLDMADLEKRFRALSRQFHPDYFVNATVAERRRSLEQSSFLNDAYRTLKNPHARLEYLLGLEGLALKGPQEASKAVPPALLEEVFALNEELDDIRALRASGGPEAEWKARLEKARGPIVAKQEEHEADLKALGDEWDALVDGGREGADGHATLVALRERMLERSYINNLLAGIERELNN